MIEYEDEIYIAVSGSNYLTKLNAAGVELKRVSFVSDNDLSAGIRYIDAEDGYIYASFYGGAVAKINAKTLEVVDKLTGLGDNLEGVAICEDIRRHIPCPHPYIGSSHDYTLPVPANSTGAKNASYNVPAQKYSHPKAFHRKGDYRA